VAQRTYKQQIPYHGRRNQPRTVTVMKATVEFPEDLYRQIEAEATRRGVPVDALIHEGLRLLLTRTDLATPRPLAGGKSFFDVMGDCCGIDGEMPEDYATNPKYLEDFGQ